MAVSEDTEITLGTGKMLALFFGLVALCAVFFGMGFSLGKNSAKPNGDALAATGASNVRPTAVKASETRAPSDLTFYKAVGQKDPNAELTAKPADAPATAAAKAAPADNDAPPDPTAVAPGPNSYFVQVAAVSKQEDAAALVDALKKSSMPPSPPALRGQTVSCAGRAFRRHQRRGRRPRPAGQGWVQSDTEEVKERLKQ